MSKLGKELTEAMTEAVGYLDEHHGKTTTHVIAVPDDVDVKAIRVAMGLNRPEFCRRFGLDVRAVQDWEQKRRRPDRAARAYLRVISRNPVAVEAALNAA